LNNIFQNNAENIIEVLSMVSSFAFVGATIALVGSFALRTLADNRNRRLIRTLVPVGAGLVGVAVIAYSVSEIMKATYLPNSLEIGAQ